MAKTRYISDLSGTGARLSGGRWNCQGISMVYTSSSRALATVEYLVHVPAAVLPKNLSIAAIDIPDDIAAEKIETTDLPENWRCHPAPVELAEMGAHWALSGRSLLLHVPSAVVAGEYNVLINPTHPEMGTVTIADVRPYVFDERLKS